MRVQAGCDLELKSLLESDASENSVLFMRYSGSLTTPLSGPVNWIIRSRPVLLALQEQIKVYSSAIPIRRAITAATATDVVEKFVAHHNINN